PNNPNPTKARNPNNFPASPSKTLPAPPRRRRERASEQPAAMGKAAKSSRKGKKAWRSNISTDDIDEFYEKQTRDAHAGAAAIPSLPSDSLFFVDKPASASTSSAATASDPPPKGQSVNPSLFFFVLVCGLVV
uniref:Ribosome biogenesis protein NOP53 n=1 Tax=Aegilops tauschii subsp. strangulata TaxID=200361 RepID=A0A452XYH4_AEGTS